MAIALSPAFAIGARAPQSDGKLSPRLVELAQPRVRSLPRREQARALGLAPSGPGSLRREGARVLVEVRFHRGALAEAEALRAAGGKILDVSGAYQVVTASVKPADLPAVGAVSGVAGVKEVLAPVLSAPEGCPSGKTVSEGDEQLHAGQARGEFNVDGSGVVVGVLSDSFDQATLAADGSGDPVATTAEQDVHSNDLPGPGNHCSETTPVGVLEALAPQDGEEPLDEGRAMAQIVHDLAPGAGLDFASAFNGELSFAKNIGELRNAGADVIVDDVAYLGEPFFQNGPVAVAAGKAVQEGATFVSAAGNSNLRDPEGHDIGSWETPAYRDAGGCPAEVQALSDANGAHCLDFNPGSQTDRTFGIRVEPGATLTVDLQWDESWNGVSTDLDAFLLNAEGRLIAESAEDNVHLTQRPAEILEWVNESSSQRVVQLVVNRFAGGSPRLKFALIENGFGVAATEYPRSTGDDVVGPTIFGHSGSAGTISVGAVGFDAEDPSLQPEEYSSRGPVRHDFAPVEGVGAAEPLGSPEILSKPDAEATDCGLTTFFAAQDNLGNWRFCGTSAAAPHAAAVAALMLQKEPAADSAEVQSALRASATSAAGFDPCAAGSGLVEAVGAIEELLTPGPFQPPTCSPPASEEPSGENSRAPGDWGLEAPPGTPTASVSPRAPATFIRKHPHRLVRTRRARARLVFTFASDQQGAAFQCKIDRGRFRKCGARFVAKFEPGRHVLEVRAVNSAGMADRTPAVFRFRVKRIS